MENHTRHLLHLVMFVALYFYCVIGYSKCGRNDGAEASNGSCVRNLSCIQHEDRLTISWSSPQPNKRIAYLIVTVSGVKIDGDYYRILRNDSLNTTVLVTSTEPMIDYSKRYSAVVTRSVICFDITGSFNIRTGCVKISPHTEEPSSFNTEDPRAHSAPPRTSKYFDKSTNRHQIDRLTNEDYLMVYSTLVPEVLENSTVDKWRVKFNLLALYGIIAVLGVAVVLLLLFIAVILCKKRSSLSKRNHLYEERLQPVPDTNLERNVMYSSLSDIKHDYMNTKSEWRKAHTTVK